MHDARTTSDTEPAGLVACASDPARVTTGALHIPAAGPGGDLTVLERLEAFRDLIRHGNSLLGEVVAYCREAEVAVSQIAAEKHEIDRIRAELQDARERADAEASAARAAMAQAETQRRELGAMRNELLSARAELEAFQSTQAGNVDALETSLRDARIQQARLEQELQRVQAHSASSRSLDARLGQVEQMEAKLRVTERELADTRRALEDERSRRDRAIALIKPRQLAGDAHA